MIIKLKKDHKLPKNATEKDIIYLLRMASKYYPPFCKVTDEYKKKFEKDIIKKLKTQELDYYYTDIDKNILLSYAVYNSHLLVTKFMLDNKYDVKEYRKDVSRALAACALVGNLDTFDFIFKNYELHSEYKKDMLLRCYELAPIMKEASNKEKYLEKATFLLNEDIHFISTMFQLVETRDSENMSESFQHFLYHHPLASHEKAFIVDELLDKPFHKLEMKKYEIEEKRKIYNSWKLIVQLENDLVESDKKTVKIKI